MFALAELSELTQVIPASKRGEVARQVARCYLDCVSDDWRDGETQRGDSFFRRLSQFRTREMPPCPAYVSDAVSPHGGGGRGIHWFETAEAVVGHITGVADGYVVPIDLVAGLIAPDSPIDLEVRPTVPLYRGSVPLLADGGAVAP